MVLASNAVSHNRVTMEASEPAERERSGNWKMLNVSLTQSGSSVWKCIPRRRTATAWVNRGALRLRARALSLHAISKEGLAFYFVSRAKVFQILGRSSGPCTLTSLYREGACKYHCSAGSFSWRALPGRQLILDDVGRCWRGWTCGGAWHHLPLESLADDHDVVSQLERREGFYSWGFFV